MASGLYIIEGGGFTISGNASVTGSGVTIFNAGSKYPSTGGTYGSISLSGNGNFTLSPPTSGTYAGVVIFQPADNTKALSISGNASSMTGEIYAPAAQLSESGNGHLDATIVVDTMTMSGNAIVDTAAQNWYGAAVALAADSMQAASATSAAGSVIGTLSADANLATSSAPSADEYQAVSSPTDPQNLYADALILAKPPKGQVADSVVDDLAVSLLQPSRGFRAGSRRSGP